MRVCSHCQKPNHNVRTCPKLGKQKTTPQRPKSTRRCGRCNQIGHNLRRCSTNLNDIPEAHQLLLKQRQGVDRLPDDNGTTPEKGMWVVNPERKRIAGKILYVKKSGIIVWENIFGAHVESNQETILDSGYQYVDLTTSHLQWEKVNYNE